MSKATAARPRIKKPKQLVVGNHVYTVRWRQMDGLHGHTIPHHNLIEIDPGHAPSQVRDTLFHESLHAVFEDGSTAQMTFEEKEGLIRDLAPRVLHLLRNNLHMVAFLLED